MVDTGNSYKDRVSQLISWGHWFIFANIIIGMLTASRYIFAQGLPDSLLAGVYLLSNWLGHFAFLAMICYVVFLFPLTFLVPYSRPMRAIGAILSTLAILLLVVDSSIYTNYHLHINLLIFDLEGFNLGSSIGWPTVVVFLLALLAVELTLANVIWKRLNKIRQTQTTSVIPSVFISAFLLSHLIHIWADATVYQPIMKMDRMFPLSYPSTARSFMARHGWIDPEAHQEKLRQSAPQHQLNYPLVSLQCSNQQANDLVVILVDSINAKLVNPQTMPNLSRLATSAFAFEQHLSSSSHPDSALFSLFTGLPAGYKQAFEQANQPAALMQIASQQRYTLADFGSDTEHQLPHLFLQTAEQQTDAQVSNLTAAEQDLASTQAWLKWQDERDASPAVSRITYHASLNFSTPEYFHRRINASIPADLSEKEQVLYRQYLQSLRFVDEQIGLLLDNIDISKTTVVITASRGMDTNSLLTGSDNFSPANIQVPMIIAMPGRSPATITTRSSHYDIAPTLLNHHFGCSNPADDHSIGIDLFATAQLNAQPPSQQQTDSLLFIGEANSFALYQDNQISVIDRHGNYKFYDANYQRLRTGELSFQSLITLMRSQKRFYH